MYLKIPDKGFKTKFTAYSYIIIIINVFQLLSISSSSSSSSFSIPGDVVRNMHVG